MRRICVWGRISLLATGVALVIWGALVRESALGASDAEIARLRADLAACERGGAR